MQDHQAVKISVVMITYNQEKYVRQAVESVLSQKVSFNIEILIADDASIDGTQNILREYKKKYPSRIRLILRKKNLGPTGNAYQLFEAARGEYIAGLEGDDYWIWDDFLQTQADYLDAHPEYIATAGRCVVGNEQGIPYPENHDFKNRDFWVFDKSEYTVDDFSEWKMPGHISAVFYRNFYREPKSDGQVFCRFSRNIGDRTTLMQLVARGKIKCYDHTVTMYRYVEDTDAGNWMAVSRKYNKRLEEYRLICACEKHLKTRWGIDPEMKELKKSKIAAAAIVWMQDKRPDSFLALTGIVLYREEMKRKIHVALEAIKQKRYWIRMGQPEHRVRVR